MGRIVVGFRGTEHEHVSQRGLESGSTRNVHDRYFEDYQPGIDVRYGAEEITEADVVRGGNCVGMAHGRAHDADLRDVVPER
jgi:hypothetical protein